MEGIGRIAAHRSTFFARSTYPSSRELGTFFKKGNAREQNGAALRHGRTRTSRVFRAHRRKRGGSGFAVGTRAKIQEPRDQVAFGLVGFLGLRVLLGGLRAVTGAMLSGWPAGAAAASSGLGLKYTRQPGESCALFLTMQAVTRSTSGISGPQSRNASPLQAASSSWV